MRTVVLALTVALGLFYGGSVHAAPQATAAKFSVRNVYGSFMVLQRDVPIRIAGSAEPGATVKISLTKTKPVTVFATADAQGSWVAVLPAQPAGGPWHLSVSGAKKSIVFTDILMGDVWFCSGQSNMEMQVWGPGKFNHEFDGDKIAQKANDPQLRLFNVPKQMGFAGPHAELTKPGVWRLGSSPWAVRNFSAVAYFFGVELRKKLGVPIGLIASSWGATPIQPWIPMAAYTKSGIEENLHQYDWPRQGTARPPKMKFQEWVAAADHEAAPEFARNAKAWTAVDVPPQGWREIRNDDFCCVNFLGDCWFRAEFALPAGFDTRGVTLRIGRIDDCDDTYLNGVKAGSTDTKTPNYWSIPRRYKIPDGLLKTGRNVVTIRVMNNNGTGGISGPVELRGQKIFSLRYRARWRCRRGYAASPGLCARHPQSSLYGPKEPAVLYNAMVAPFTVFPVKGVLWYQGCANKCQATDYEELQRVWLKSWREAWRQNDLPFVITQLSGLVNHQQMHPIPEKVLAARKPAQNPGFAPLRDAQMALLSDTIGVAVTLDLGCPSDIHPQNKKEFAPRLAAEALRVAYHSQEVCYGPLFASLKREGRTLRVSFQPSSSPLVTKDGRPPRGFAVRGSNAKGETVTVWAETKIDHQDVVLSYPDFLRPHTILYAWEDYAYNLNLTNAAGFPAYPFRAAVPK